MNDLDQALADAVERYRAAHPQSARIHADALQALPGGNTRSVLFFAPFPPAMARGEGCYLWDADGHRYLDALGEFTAGIYGHSEPAIRAAITEALAGGLSLSSHTAREGALAREVQRRFPAMELLRFTNSGTEANRSSRAATTAACWRLPAAARRSTCRTSGSWRATTTCKTCAPKWRRTRAIWRRFWSSR